MTSIHIGIRIFRLQWGRFWIDYRHLVNLSSNILGTRLLLRNKQRGDMNEIFRGSSFLELRRTISGDFFPDAPIATLFFFWLDKFTFTNRDFLCTGIILIMVFYLTVDTKSCSSLNLKRLIV
ncbi:uncharacterized protein LOC114275035 isoform X2 [Camellia sinensis]|uniref:uncharacterized protein LOC114275035 isoform X2 n=1 Tax=Camellia sinensis TaxID=4442 RepID=UPI001035BFC3|nr:uncharacterized protein LOC114275035 isoform X2 [Camellia sinensis]